MKYTIFEKFKGVSTNANKKLKNIDDKFSLFLLSTPSYTTTANEGDEPHVLGKTIRPMGRNTFKKAMKREWSKALNVEDLLQEMRERERERDNTMKRKMQILLSQKSIYKNWAKYGKKLGNEVEVARKRGEGTKKCDLSENLNYSNLNDVQREYYTKMQEKNSSQMIHLAI